MAEPVCLYFSKEGCGACTNFNPHWDAVQRRLGNRIRMIKFTCSQQNLPPAPFRSYVNYFPTVIICSSADYNAYFNQYGNMRFQQNGYIPAAKFNAVYANGTWHHTKDQDNADNLIRWINGTAPRFMAK